MLCPGLTSARWVGVGESLAAAAAASSSATSSSSPAAPVTDGPGVRRGSLGRSPPPRSPRSLLPRRPEPRSLGSERSRALPPRPPRHSHGGRRRQRACAAGRCRRAREGWTRRRSGSGAGREYGAGSAKGSERARNGPRVLRDRGTRPRCGAGGGGAARE